MLLAPNFEFWRGPSISHFWSLAAFALLGVLAGHTSVHAANSPGRYFLPCWVSVDHPLRGLYTDYTEVSRPTSSILHLEAAQIIGTAMHSSVTWCLLLKLSTSCFAPKPFQADFVTLTLKLDNVICADLFVAPAPIKFSTDAGSTAYFVSIQVRSGLVLCIVQTALELAEDL